MSARDLAAQMEIVRAALERAAKLLVNPVPRNLEDCQSALDMAASRLAGCTADLDRHTGDPALLAESIALRQGVRHAAFLLHTAAEHHRKWYQILRAKMGGYTSEGCPAEISGAGRIWLRG